MNQPCGRCTKVVYSTEKMEAGNKHYHKLCFKCADSQCGITLTLKTLKTANGEIYCMKHVPKATATSVSDSVSVMHALHAPKKASEGLKKTQVDPSGQVPKYGLNSVNLQHNVNAPKKAMEGLITSRNENAPRAQAQSQAPAQYKPTAQHQQQEYEQPAQVQEYQQEAYAEQGYEAPEGEYPQEYPEQVYEGQEGAYDEQAQANEYYNQEQYPVEGEYVEGGEYQGEYQAEYQEQQV